MVNALHAALREIHNPGSNRHDGLDIVSHIEEVLKFEARAFDTQ